MFSERLNPLDAATAPWAREPLAKPELGGRPTASRQVVAEAPKALVHVALKLACDTAPSLLAGSPLFGCLPAVPVPEELPRQAGVLREGCEGRIGVTERVLPITEREPIASGDGCGLIRNSALESQYGSPAGRDGVGQALGGISRKRHSAIPWPRSKVGASVHPSALLIGSIEQMLALSLNPPENLKIRSRGAGGVFLSGRGGAVRVRRGGGPRISPTFDEQHGNEGDSEESRAGHRSHHDPGLQIHGTDRTARRGGR